MSSHRRRLTQKHERIVDMTKEEYMHMSEQMKETVHKIYERIARKINSGEPMELCEMSQYTDMLKDLAETVKDLHKAHHYSEGAVKVSSAAV
jgi:nucleoid-associated protein YejK